MESKELSPQQTLLTKGMSDGYRIHKARNEDKYVKVLRKSSLLNYSLAKVYPLPNMSNRRINGTSSSHNYSCKKWN